MKMNPALAAVVLGAALAGCGSDKSPAGSNPAPTPAPTPAPAASPTPQSFSCPLAAMPDLHNTCPKLSPQLSEYVDRAIAQTVRDHPGLFDLHDDLFDGNYRVLDRSQYVKAVVEAIHAQGVCAVEEFEEIAVKTSNDFNEQYNIWVSTGGYIRKGPGAYITTCFPAQF
ncbi:MAG TPA: hypothetical protein VGN09_22075 [Vicinamibacteria bacterium]